MRVLVTGGAGMLGSALIPELVRAGHAVTVTDIDLSEPRPWGSDGPTIEQLDVRDRNQVLTAFDRVRPQFVCHLAAETSLEVCETEPDGAAATNAIGTKWVALACQRNDTTLAYISTAGVFDGEKPTAYDEFDPPNPINVYGQTKLAGEHLVASLLSRYYIVRAGWMVGGGRTKDHKFVSRILQQLRDGAEVIHAVGDKFGTPTYAPDFARCFVSLIDTEAYGLYHMAGTGYGTRLDVARRILEVLGRDDVELVEVESPFFATEFFAPRPRSEIMRNRMLDLQGMNTMRSWDVAVADYLHAYFADAMALASARRG